MVHGVAHQMEQDLLEGFHGAAIEAAAYRPDLDLRCLAEGLGQSLGVVSEAREEWTNRLHLEREQSDEVFLDEAIESLLGSLRLEGELSQAHRQAGEGLLGLG